MGYTNKIKEDYFSVILFLFTLFTKNKDPKYLPSLSYTFQSYNYTITDITIQI